MQYDNPSMIEVLPVTSPGVFEFEVDADEGVDVMFVFTNVNTSLDSIPPDVEVATRVDGAEFATPTRPTPLLQCEHTEGINGFIDESTREIVKSLDRNQTPARNHQSIFGQDFNSDVVGGTQSFNVIQSGGIDTETSTCRLSIGPVATSFGERTLNIWVADNCWETGGDRSHLITGNMVDALGESFLAEGSFNDIYDWTTAIIGAEWGTTPFSELIPHNQEITILLSDIEDDDSSNGGIVGYFWAGNNVKPSELAGSNGRVMFVVDAVMYANPSDNGGSVDPDDQWSTDDYWPTVVFSTLAHEFQHMIHFYQKNIVFGAPDTTDTWINEMCSMLVEDFLADKIDVAGPRGVDPQIADSGGSGNTNGRLPGFNAYLDRSLFVDGAQQFELEDYSISYAFGAWLARNHGGVELLGQLVRSPHVDPAAIESAVMHVGDRVSFDDLLQQWAIAVTLSDRTDAPTPFVYNNGGWFRSTIDGHEYRLGSINLFDYKPMPSFAASTAQLSYTSIEAGSSAYLLATSNKTGTKTWEIEVPETVRLSVVTKVHE